MKTRIIECQGRYKIQVERPYWLFWKKWHTLCGPTGHANYSIERIFDDFNLAKQAEKEYHNSMIRKEPENWKVVSE